jgi:hypothetical protein
MVMGLTAYSSTGDVWVRQNSKENCVNATSGANGTGELTS